jgi:hypothetical protein
MEEPLHRLTGAAVPFSDITIETSAAPELRMRGLPFLVEAMFREAMRPSVSITAIRPCISGRGPCPCRCGYGLIPRTGTRPAYLQAPDVGLSELRGHGHQPWRECVVKLLPVLISVLVLWFTYLTVYFE